MKEENIYEETFEKLEMLTKGEYECCQFNNCNFAELDLSNFKFLDCNFNNCNLSMAIINKTTFRDVIFKDCKMLGLRFDTCNEFGLSFTFESCQLQHTSFYQTKIAKTKFKNSNLIEVDFTATDLSNSLFDNCNLSLANFERTNLEHADLRTATNYNIDPENNKIKKAKFSIWGLAGLLEKYQIDISQ